MTDIFEQWRDGAITDTQVLRALASDLGEIESDIKPMELQREQIRADISYVIAKVGITEIPGFGRLELTPASRTRGYDKAMLNELVIQLTAEGYGTIAQQIAQCRTETPRAGALRITRSKS